MNRTQSSLLTTLLLSLAVTGVWTFRHSAPVAPPAAVAPAPRTTGTGVTVPSPSPPAPLSAAGELEAGWQRLAASRDPAANRLILGELRRRLDSLPPEAASREVRGFLGSGRDADTRLEVAVEAGGGLKAASSLRVFLLDYLGRTDRAAAGEIAAQILSAYTTSDEWAVSLRNFAWAHPGPEAGAFLQAKARELLANPAWVRDASCGFLEAFDTIVYAHGTALTPELTALMRDRENRAVAHAAYLTLDRLTIAEPARMLRQLVTQPELMAGREQTRANFVARADVGEPEQRALAEQYLLDPRRDPAELATFASLYPNANYRISHNLLTSADTPGFAQLAARDRAALQVVEQWRRDPRFERCRPLLAQIHERLQTFVRQAAAREL